MNPIIEKLLMGAGVGVFGLTLKIANDRLRERDARRKLRPKRVGYPTPNDRVSGVKTSHHQNAKPPLQGQKRI